MRPMPSTLPFRALSQTLSARPAATHVGLAARTRASRSFTSSTVRRDDQSRAKAESVKQVINRPEITPLFLFTGAIIGLALFFGGRHLVKDTELRLDHAQQNRLKTQTEQLDFDAMAKVADDPEGKLTKQAMEEDKKRTERREQIRKDKEEDAKKKL